jgi:L,D-transpeptidase ErfK/SrfK
MKKIGKLVSIGFLFAATNVFAAAYSVPPANESLIGNMQFSTVSNGDTVVTIAKRYDIGYNAIENANPQLNMAMGFPIGTPLQIPTQHLLPNLPRVGIIINLPEMRMYYFPDGTNQVYTYPIGIGKIGKTIPITRTAITRKTKNPSWIPPEDIRQFNLDQGIVLPKVMPPGPDNPLGPYAIYMQVPTYLIHSTIFPESVGKRASFGCIRMYESDIEDFFPSITKGIPVNIINQPTKIAWQDNHLYMESHEPLEEHNKASGATLASMVHLIDETTQSQPMLIDWQAVAYIDEERDGLPHQIGMKLLP